MGESNLLLNERYLIFETYPINLIHYLTFGRKLLMMKAINTDLIKLA